MPQKTPVLGIASPQLMMSRADCPYPYKVQSCPAIDASRACPFLAPVLKQHDIISPFPGSHPCCTHTAWRCRQDSALSIGLWMQAVDSRAAEPVV